MFGRVNDFLRRHRYKLLVASGVAGGLVILGKYAESKLKEWQENETSRFLEKARKSHHFETTQRTCNLTLKSLFTLMRKTLDSSLGVEEILKEIRARPEEKVALWNRLKVVALTRCLALLYGSVLLGLMLRAQFNIVGGYLYKDVALKEEEDANSNKKMGMTPKTQEAFFWQSQKFAGDGFADFCLHLQEIITRHATKFDLKQKVTLIDLRHIFQGILKEVRETVDINNPPKYLISMEQKDQNWSNLDKNEKGAYAKMCSDLLDILEQSDFQKLTEESLDTQMSLLFEELLEDFEELGQNSETEISLPIAKIIPKLNSATKTDTDSNGHKQDKWALSMMTSDSVNKFSANIYEAFALASMEDTSNYYFGRFIQRFV